MMKHLLVFLFSLAAVACAQTQPDVLTTNASGQINRNVKVPSGKTLTIESGGTLNVASGGTFSGVIGTQVFADNTARLAAAPAFVGQLGLQVNDGSLWQADGLSAGNWQAEFVMRHYGNVDAKVLKLQTDFNSSASAPILSIEATDISFAGKLFSVSNDGGETLYITSAGEVMSAAYYFASDTNTGVVWGGADTVVIYTGAANRVTVNTAVMTLEAGMSLAVPKTITAGATTGAQTIDKMAGSVNFAAAATSLVVTNALVTTSSVIVATVATNDSTMKSVQAVAGSGSFTLYANAAATAETRVNWIVVN